MTQQLLAHHPVVGYTFVPHLHTRVAHEGGGYAVECNGAGFRCQHEFTPRSSAGTFRVLLFGDSFAAGEGVDNRDRFGDLIERRLHGLEVLNFGLSAAATGQQYLAFREFAKDLEYDLLMICPLVDNIDQNVTPGCKLVSFSDGTFVERAKPYFVIERGEPVVRNVPCPAEARATEPDDWRASGGRLRRCARLVYDRFPGLSRAVKRFRDIRHPKAYENAQDPAWLLMKRILERWVEESHSPVLICPLPLFGHIDRAYAADNIRMRFAELALGGKATVADILPDYWRMAPSERRGLVYPGDEHPTRRGHQAIADSLEPYVRRFREAWRAGRP